MDGGHNALLLINEQHITMIKLTYTNTMATLDTIEHAEIEFKLAHMGNFTEACRALAYCAGFDPDAIDSYMINPHGSAYRDE